MPEPIDALEAEFPEVPTLSASEGDPVGPAPEEAALHVETEQGEFEHAELFDEGVLDEDDLGDDLAVEEEIEDLELRHIETT